MDTAESNRVSVRASSCLALSHAYTQSLGSTTKLSCFGKFCMPLGYCSFL